MTDRLSSCRRTRSSRSDGCAAKRNPQQKRPARRYHRNQQYSVTALTDATGTISERYAYDAYGKLTVLDSGGTVLGGSAYGNRYTYTGREWDDLLGLYHYRARMYSPESGRFVSRDPIGYWDGPTMYANYFLISHVDPSGTEIRLIPEDLVDHPWNSANLFAGVLGETQCHFSIWCSCNADWVFTSSCNGFEWLTYHTMSCKVTLRTTIALDKAAIKRAPGHSINGVYGHEIEHAKNCRYFARLLEGQQGGVHTSDAGCQQGARSAEVSATDAWSVWWATERAHLNWDDDYQSPWHGTDYPIDYEEVDPYGPDSLRPRPRF